MSSDRYRCGLRAQLRHRAAIALFVQFAFAPPHRLHHPRVLLRERHASLRCFGRLAADHRQHGAAFDTAIVQQFLLARECGVGTLQGGGERLVLLRSARRSVSRWRSACTTANASSAAGALGCAGAWPGPLPRF